MLVTSKKERLIDTVVSMVKSFVSEHTSRRVICRDDINTAVHCPSDGEVNWRPPCAGTFTLCAG